MRRAICMLLAAVAVAACARKDEDVAADSPAAAAMPALTFADFAGRWNVQFLGDMSDSVLATYELNARTLSAPRVKGTTRGDEPRVVSFSDRSKALLN